MSALRTLTVCPILSLSSEHGVLEYSDARSFVAEIFGIFNRDNFDSVIKRRRGTHLSSLPVDKTATRRRSIRASRQNSFTLNLSPMVILLGRFSSHGTCSPLRTIQITCVSFVFITYTQMHNNVAKWKQKVSPCRSVSFNKNISTRFMVSSPEMEFFVRENAYLFVDKSIHTPVTICIVRCVCACSSRRILKSLPCTRVY